MPLSDFFPRGAIWSPEAVAAMAVLKRLERYGPDGHVCFPRGCTFSDIDGVIELDDRFLFLEVKRTGQIVSAGQEILLHALVRMGMTPEPLSFRIVVVVKWINDVGEVVGAHLVQPNPRCFIQEQPCTEMQLVEFFRLWAGTEAPVPTAVSVVHPAALLRPR
jgi:hypothetical protein